MAPRIIRRPEPPPPTAPFLEGWKRGLVLLGGHARAFSVAPLRASGRMGTLALSLLLHPWRNGARALRLLAGSHPHRLLGEGLALGLSAPLVVPFLALVRLRLHLAEARFETARLQRIREAGRAAPPGRTPIGSAVNQAVWGTARGSVSPEQAISSGGLREVWLNPTDGVDLAVHRACELIRREACREVRLQTYLFDPKSAAGQDLVATLAQKQRSNPEFRIMAVVDRSGLERTLARQGVQAQVAIARPWWSRRGHHAKTFVIDGRIAILGGDNIDSPREKDLMAVVEGPIVRSMLADFADAWEQAVRPRERAPLSEVPPAPQGDGTVPMTLLTKRGVTGLWGEDYRDNDSDQAILAALRAACSEILIETPCLNADVVLQALEAAAARGVEVRICLPLKQHNRLATRLDAADNGSFIAFWCQLPPALRKRIAVRNFSSNAVTAEENHTKFVCVDRQWTYVGSQNLDNQSFAYSRELGIGIDDPETSRRLAEEVFERDWLTSLPITPRWTERRIPYALWYH